MWWALVGRNMVGLGVEWLVLFQETQRRKQEWREGQEQTFTMWLKIGVGNGILVNGKVD